MKHLPKLILVTIMATLLSGCSIFGLNIGPKPPQPTSRKQLINILPIKDRPFVAVFPHSTNKLITLYFDKVGDAKNITIDLEYLSGNALKGGRTSITSSSFPYSQAFLLGSCSAGGKCSFDTDITTGTVKTKLEVGSDLHLLKSNFVFITKDSTATSDQKATLTFSKSKAALILSQTHGYLGTITQEAAGEPVAITSTSTDQLSATLTLTAPDATSALIFNGTSYQPLTSVKKQGDKLIIELTNLKPWSKSVTIVRDDLKGSQEEATLNLIGPIIPIK